MVSLMKKTYILPVLVLAVCGTAMICHFARPRPVKHDAVYWRSVQQELLRKGEKLSIDWDMPPGYVPPYKWADDAERKYLNSLWAGAATNLVELSVKDMEEKISLVTERMKSVCPEQWDGIVSPFYSLLRSRVDRKSIPDKFSEATDFHAYMEATLRGMNLIGEIELQSCTLHAPTAWWECNALSTLKEYRKRFTDTDRKSLAECAESFIAQLISQIESEQGLTRRYMHAAMKFQMQLVDSGVSTRESVIRGVRADAYALVKVAGYIPKWLDEEFPLPAKSEETGGL